MLISRERFDWDYFVRKFEEAEAFQGQMATDVADIDQGTDVITGWEDLSGIDASNPLWADLMNDPNSMAAAKIQQLASDAETYMQSVQIQVQQPNAPAGQYVDLYVGTASVDGDGNIIENYQDESYDPDSGYYVIHGATLWEVISGGPNMQLVSCDQDGYFDDAWCHQDWRMALGCNWAYDYNLSFCTESDDVGDGGGWAAAQGTLAQWGNNIHYSGGDPSALNRDLNS